jgi:GC-rich sequence DNA-binding factor
MMVCRFPMSIFSLLRGGIYPEFAEYTSAQERIALGKKGRKAEVKKRREEMENLIADTYEKPPVASIPLTSSSRLEDNEEEKEWEQEQIRRGGHRDDASETQVSGPQVYKPSPSMYSHRNESCAF